MTTEILKIESWRQKSFWFLASLSAVILISYIYLVNNIIFNLATRTDVISEREQLTLTLSQLEASYLMMADNVTIERAYALGFEEAGANASFVTVSNPILAYGHGD